MKAILASVTVQGDKGYAQRIQAGAHSQTADEPIKRGGTNTGPAPFELLLASLGACTAITLRMYAERKQWDLGTINVKLRLAQEDDALHIERTVNVTGPLDQAQRQRLLEMVDKTPVTKLVALGVPITSAIEEGS